MVRIADQDNLVRWSPNLKQYDLKDNLDLLAHDGGICEIPNDDAWKEKLKIRVRQEREMTQHHQLHKAKRNQLLRHQDHAVNDDEMPPNSKRNELLHADHKRTMCQTLVRNRRNLHDAK